MILAHDDYWHTVNDLHTPFLAAAIARPLLDRRDIRNSARVGEALVFAYVSGRTLKSLFRERRPGGGGNDSFPSGHAATAFAVATMDAALYPREAPFWLGGAALLSVARNEIGVHYFADVVGGAALGYGLGRLLVRYPNGLVIAPLFREGARGVSLTMRF
ncbi:MAG: phosphatase PAP2 family protein [Armatimonadota bacterium]